MSRFEVVIELPVGVEEGDELHTRCVVGPLIAGAGLEADTEAAEVPPGSIDADRWRGICRLAARIRTVGTLPGPYTGAWLLTVPDEDFRAVIEASQGVDQRVASFRGARTANAPGGLPGGARDGVVVKRDPGNV